MKLYCATTNPGKLAEIRLACGRFGVDLEPLPGLRDVPPCPETGVTFEENAVQKALYYGAHCEGYLFADDSGLEVDSLHDEPGVYSARFAGPGATDEENNRLLLDRMRGVESRAARFVCAVALACDGRLVATFRGVVEGTLLEAPRGAGGFGYDPLFYHPPCGCTLAEIDAERKLSVSHRGQALTAMLRYLSSTESRRSFCHP